MDSENTKVVNNFCTNAHRQKKIDKNGSIQQANIQIAILVKHNCITVVKSTYV